MGWNKRYFSVLILEKLLFHSQNADLQKNALTFSRSIQLRNQIDVQKTGVLLRPYFNQSRRHFITQIKRHSKSVSDGIPL